MGREVKLIASKTDSFSRKKNHFSGCSKMFLSVIFVTIASFQGFANNRSQPNWFIVASKLVFFFLMQWSNNSILSILSQFYYYILILQFYNCGHYLATIAETLKNPFGLDFKISRLLKRFFRNFQQVFCKHFLIGCYILHAISYLTLTPTFNYLTLFP